MRDRGCSNEGIVGGATCYGVLRQLQDKILVGSSVQTKERFGEPQAEKIANNGTPANQSGGRAGNHRSHAHHTHVRVLTPNRLSSLVS